MAIFGLTTIFCFIAVLIENASTPEQPIVICDTTNSKPIEVVLNGEKEVTIFVGEEYAEAGAEVYDGCLDTILTIGGEVNISKPGDYVISYTAHDGVNSDVIKKRTVHVIDHIGTIYLTFDDGPGPYTYQLLDVLAKYNVKATFFVTGAGDDTAILREYKEGHAVGLHTWSHNYSYIYTSTENFFEDLYAVQERVKDITGETSYLMRFPGGSSNTVSTRYDGRTRIMSRLASEVENRGFTYFDWNITSGDAGGTTTSDGIYENVVGRLEEPGDYVVLQHDIKGFSVDAVESIIRYGLSHGYKFDKLSKDAPTAHHHINN